MTAATQDGIKPAEVYFEERKREREYYEGSEGPANNAVAGMIDKDKVFSSGND